MADEAKQQGGEKRGEEPTYHRDRLVAEGYVFFGQPPFVVHAALAHANVGSKVNFSRSQVEKMIDRYHNHEVEYAYSTTDGEEAS